MVLPQAVGRRVVVVGDSGSGKSSVGTRLARHLGTELIELDALYWGPGWTPIVLDAFRSRVAEAVDGDAWVLAGNYESQQMEISWGRAETVVWLDLPLRVTIPRLLARSYRRWRSSERIWGGNTERFWEQFMLWSPTRSLIAWTLTRHGPRRRRYEAAMREPEYAHVSWHRLRSPDEVDGWLKQVEGEQARPGGPGGTPHSY